MTVETWKDILGDSVPEELGQEIDIFESQMALRKQGRVDEKIFAETRLRRGVYGQRYDNGQRHDGVETQPLEFPCGELTKGPETVWDAPGMMRIKIPMGRMSAEQMDVLAELAEEYSDAILHVTTRQDIQLHFVHIEDTPSLQRRLAAVGITTREACGNSVRNVCACQFAGVCETEAFDITPYAQGLTMFLLGHKDVQDFGRKFKIAFSGCLDKPCGLANFHDVGVVAEVREVDGELQRGFRYVVGGGLGAVPRQAKVLDEFLPVEELLPMTQAVCRVFARLGEKQNRSRARLKFLVDKVGIEEFEKLVREEREEIPYDPRWTEYLAELHATDDEPLAEVESAEVAVDVQALSRWQVTNVRPQKQDGYVVATVRLPLGDCTSDQFRALADLARRFTGDTVRLTVEQNLVFRWLREQDVPAFYAQLRDIELHEAGASTLSDITACPGTDTCKLGISASRGLARELEHQLGAKADTLDEGVKKLRIKASGCFNSCGQHHVADIGFLGVSRAVAGRRVAHFQLVVGGEWANNGGSYGLAIGAFPSKRIPEVVDRLTDHWVAEREDGERFQDFISRIGKKAVRSLLDDLKAVPAYEKDPSFYVDWGDSREYTIGDMGQGECAGEVVSVTEFGLSEAERQAFEAQLRLDLGQPREAWAMAFRAMLTAAKGLIYNWNIDITDDADEIVGEFRTRLYDTRLFHDPFAKGKFGAYLFKAASERPNGREPSADEAHRQIEEANLFIEAAYGCWERIQSAGGPEKATPAVDSLPPKMKSTLTTL